MYPKSIIPPNIDYSKILKPNIVNKDITPSSAISKVNEYFRYSVIGDICIVDIGGITFNSSGLSQYAVESGLPVAKTRPVGLITTDPGGTGVQGMVTVIYGKIGGDYLQAQIPSGFEGKSLYGQIIYLI